mmetsp:Transcript_29245/g.82538  ORF Transcript_29245/g.82538 Transcript_29245/m.82538 type:complete len:412 (-) Transcript_29245:129-1364(-)|eukprot:CAMPEP_0117682308 /NCGR_PEP_ID=MMETSP0804-20121206/19573_1 /TAXON_ID=1074897 /ORGANISM="Tetraselmis astigmatica, Strain CCMP880" /LENGTH=411 /DNA_ID=CAMNT_0005492377 /DNA_START=251 /DNA_END=1486 /DNA_ORIENTATION=+
MNASTDPALECLHESVLPLILRHLGEGDVVSLALACRSLSRQVPVALGNTKLRMRRKPPGSSCWAIRHSYITHLDVTGLPDFSLSEAEVKLLPKLETLALGRASRLSCLQTAPGAGVSLLKVLDLSHCSDVQGLSGLSHLTALTNLNLQGRESLTDKELTVVAKLPELQLLNLGGCTSLTDKGLTAISALPGLRELSLSRCRGITDQGFLRSLPRMVHLETLDLTHCSISDKGLAALQGLKKLTNLCLAYCRLITDAGMSALGNLQSLQALDAEFCELGSDCLMGLTDLKNLETLGLRGCLDFDDRGLQMLRDFPALTSLNCAFTAVTGTGLHGLPPSLADLNLAFCPLLDHTIPHLRHLPRLQSLNLRSSAITDAGTVPLLEMTSLTLMDLSCCRGVSDARLAILSSLGT